MSYTIKETGLLGGVGWGGNQESFGDDYTTETKLYRRKTRRIWTARLSHGERRTLNVTNSERTLTEVFSFLVPVFSVIYFKLPTYLKKVRLIWVPRTTTFMLS